MLTASLVNNRLDNFDLLLLSDLRERRRNSTPFKVDGKPVRKAGSVCRKSAGLIRAEIPSAARGRRPHSILFQVRIQGITRIITTASFEKKTKDKNTGKFLLRKTNEGLIIAMPRKDEGFNRISAGNG